MDWTSFHDLTDIEGFEEWLNFTVSDLVQVASVARTLEGREVRILRIADPSTPGPKKKIWIEGGESSSLTASSMLDGAHLLFFL